MALGDAEAPGPTDGAGPSAHGSPCRARRTPGPRDHSVSLVPFCGWRAPLRAAVEDPARNSGLTAAHPGGDHSQMSVQSHTPSTCSRPSPSRALHGEHLHSRPCRDKPTPVSRLLTGAVTGHEIESKAHKKAASRPRSPPWGIQGRRLACSPEVDPHRWPMFHGCGDKSGHRESELSPRPNQIPVGRRALPFPSRTPVARGNLRESHHVLCPPHKSPLSMQL